MHLLGQAFVGNNKDITSHHIFRFGFGLGFDGAVVGSSPMSGDCRFGSGPRRSVQRGPSLIAMALYCHSLYYQRLNLPMKSKFYHNNRIRVYDTSVVAAYLLIRAKMLVKP